MTSGSGHAERAPPVRVATFYHFTPFDDPAEHRVELLARCRAAGVCGTVVLAHEGINGTIAGSVPGVAAALDVLAALPGCSDVAVSFSAATAPPFDRMKVEVRRELVTMGLPTGGSRASSGGRGIRVAAADWNALIDDSQTLVIDTRNAYETAIGSFVGAVDPATASFAQFPGWFDTIGARLADDKKRIAMFCTGGIRCEKASALLRARGVEVYQLGGGILDYLATTDPATSRWLGACFVFDARVALGHGLTGGTHHLCRGCGWPIALNPAPSERCVNCERPSRPDEQRQTAATPEPSS